MITIHTELKFDIVIRDEKELAEANALLEQIGQSEAVRLLTKDVYEVFESELDEAENVEINVTLSL